MKKLIVLIFLCTCSQLMGQTTHEYMTWVSAGAEGKVIKKLKWSAALNTRFSTEALETFFPEAGLEYKLFKWLRPSLEYRFLIDKNDYDNYKSGSSFRTNLNFRFSEKRFKFGARLRYQYSFNRLGSSYDSDFDQAVRFKPFIQYDIKGSKITPLISTEFYYDPVYGPKGRRFTKNRYAVGVSYEFDSPHEIGVKYQVDHYLGKFPIRFKHIVSLSYNYKF